MLRIRRFAAPKNGKEGRDDYFASLRYPDSGYPPDTPPPWCLQVEEDLSKVKCRGDHNCVPHTALTQGEIGLMFGHGLAALERQLPPLTEEVHEIDLEDQEGIVYNLVLEIALSDLRQRCTPKNLLDFLRKWERLLRLTVASPAMTSRRIHTSLAGGIKLLQNERNAAEVVGGVK